MDKPKNLMNYVSYLFAIFVLVIFGLLSLSKAHAEIRIAYAWANNATAASYSPDADYVKIDDQDIRITRLSTGRYRVQLGSLIAGRGNVQVSTYGSKPIACQVSSWGAEGANVFCFNTNGDPADTPFTILATYATATEEIAYVWADKPSDIEYVPASAYAFSPHQQPRILRKSSGRYEVQLSPKLATGGTTVQVTPYGTEPRHCGVVSWNNGRISIKCSDYKGQPADTRFTLLTLKNSIGDAFAFAWANEATSSDYTPSETYAHASGMTPHIRRTSRGRYSVILNKTIGNIQVTPYGNVAIDCHTVSWSSDIANVACFDPAGIPTDAQFTILSTLRSPTSPILPDLIVSLEGLPATITPGGSLGKDAKVIARNKGSNVASGNRPGHERYMIDIVLSTDQVAPEGFATFFPTYREDVLLRGGRISNTSDVAPDMSATFSIENDTIPSDTPLGNYYVCARIDPGRIVAELNEENNVACVKVRVEKTVPTQAAPNLIPAKKYGSIEIRLNQKFYKSGDQVQAQLDLGNALISSDLEGIILVSEETGDIEHLIMRRTSGSIFTDSADVIVHMERGTVADKFDGRLSAQPGERIIAFFYPDPDRHRVNTDAGIVADIAIFETAQNRRNSEGVPITSVSRTEPALHSFDRASAAPGERDFGSFLIRGTLPVQVATREVLFRPRSNIDLQAFLAFSGGSVMSSQPASDEGSADNPEDRIYLVAVDLSRTNVDSLPDLRRLFGESGELLLAGDEVWRLYALILESRMRGFAVAANQKIAFMASPSTTETQSGTFNRTGDPGDLIAPLIIPPRIDLPAAWAFNALWDGDERRINVGVVDMGFIPNHPDFRKPAAGPMRECSFDDGFVDDVILRDGHCGPGRAGGIPTVGNSFFAGRTWHGTGVVVTLGGVLNNGWRPGIRPGESIHTGGSAGTGGQVVVPMLYKTGLSSYVYEMGAAVRQAVDDGASCINISAGYPCRVQSTILPDIDLCAPGGRDGLCFAMLGVASVAAASVCASVGPIAAIPIIGPILAAPIIAACATSTAAVPLILPSCQTFFIASGDVRNAMRVGVDYAARNGVPVVSISGNQIQGSIPEAIRPLIDLTNIDSDDWGIIPGILPNVISVGAVNDRLMNQHFVGISVAIWAPIETRYHAPDNPDIIPMEFDEHFSQSLGGTSAAAPYVTGVIALMQAINPSLNPTTPGLSAAARASIPARVRTLLTSSSNIATSPDPLVRGIVSPNLSLMAAARAAGVPLLPGYDTQLNFNETSPASAQDTASQARSLGFGETVTGTILSVSGEDGVSRTDDVDWFSVMMPPEPSDGGTFELTARLRMPTASRWGRLIIDGRNWELVSETEINPNETEMIFVKRLIPGGIKVEFLIKGVSGEDNVYLLTVAEPRHVPIPVDPIEGTTPHLDGWILLSETSLAKTWQLVDNRPTLHRTDDSDTYTIGSIPPSLAFGSIPSGGCAPHLEISHPNGVEITYLDDKGVGPIVLDPRRRVRATVRNEEGITHPVSVLDYSSESSIPSSITLTYSLSAETPPMAYDLRLTFITVEVGARGICEGPLRF